VSYQLEFEKNSLIALGIAGLLLGIVLFFAGFFVHALLIERSLPAETIRLYPGSKRPPTATAPLRKETASPPRATGPVSAPNSHAAGNMAQALQLAVQVGTFADAGQAKHLAEELREQGFSPVIAPQVGASHQELSVVEVGPFAAWEDASHIAQLIGRSLGTRPAIRPML
jgi:cell division septation protein DedD